MILNDCINTIMTKTKTTVTKVVRKGRRRTKRPRAGLRVGQTTRTSGKRRAQLSRFAVAETDAGMRYLECAIAPRDFPGVASGIPDSFCGKSAVIRQKLLMPVGPPADVSAFWNCSIVIPPIPNVGCMLIANKDTVVAPNTATATWSVFDYANANTVFPAPGTSPEYGSSMVQKFRYVSLTAELKMVGPVLTTGGTISAARVPGFGLVTTMAATSFADTKRMTGFDDIDQIDLQPLPGFYVGHVNAGVYSWSIHQDPEVFFSDVWIDSPYANIGYTESGTPIKGVASSSGYFMGFGQQQALGIAITNASASTTFVLEVEAVIEYQPRSNSLMAEMMSDAPPHDRLALDSYQQAVRQMPACVPVSQNSGFWDTFLRVISFVAPLAGRIFGPIGGVIGGAVGASAATIRAMRAPLKDVPLD